MDTALPNSAKGTQSAFEDYFGGPPKAIVLTHAHFDYVGGAPYLTQAWDVPVYVHRLETPYVTGQSDYPTPDPTLGSPLAFMSRFSKAKGTDLGDCVQQLEGEQNGAVPHLAEWQWIFTPGHAPSHIALWRESDSVLLADDAVATMNVDSLPELIRNHNSLPAPERLLYTTGPPRVLLSYVWLSPKNFLCPNRDVIHEGAQTDEHGVVWLPPAPSRPNAKNRCCFSSTRRWFNDKKQVSATLNLVELRFNRAIPQEYGAVPVNFRRAARR